MALQDAEIPAPVEVLPVDLKVPGANSFVEDSSARGKPSESAGFQRSGEGAASALQNLQAIDRIRSDQPVR